MVACSCGVPSLEPATCFDDARRDIPLEQCFEVTEALHLPGRDEAERERILALCDAPCLKVDLIQLHRRSSSEPIPLLSKVRFLTWVILSRNDQTRDLSVFPLRPDPGLFAWRLDISNEVFESFEGLPDDSVSQITAAAVGGLRDFRGLERQSRLTSVEVFRTRLSSLVGLGLAPALERLSIHLDGSLESLDGLVGIRGRLAFLLSATQVRSLGGAGPDLRFSRLTFTSNQNLSQCEAVAFAERYGVLRAQGTQIEGNKPCP